ncbi:hypothetical protein JRQ81_013246 [Phrynocephalus forsythii]|uniref:Uncharacterized protein n=1 Tax=Phrynocephalus forsythii TaxID=171643 RepID=A0A9Q0XYR4_9SAUR|nr:hypothetical protein JRQ81_013246 [Phrynocephalus forsythii]
MMAEDSCDPGFSGDKPNTFSHGSRKEQHVPHMKPIVCTEDNIEDLDGGYAAMHIPTPLCERSSQRRKPHTHRMLRLVREQGNPLHAWTAGNRSVDEVLNFLPRHPRRPQRKSPWQRQQEEEAAVTIQSAWRGWQVRKEMDRMERAATQIQAAFRGYMTRKELPLGICCSCRTDWPTPKQKSAENKSQPFPLFLTCTQQLGLGSGTQTESLSVFFPNNRGRICPKTIPEDSPLLNPNASFFESKSAIRPDRKVFTYASLNVFASKIRNQKYQEEAATIIQAAWRGYQIRQKARPRIQAAKSTKSLPSNFIVNKSYWRRLWSGHTVEERGIQQIFANSAFRKAPQIRNINIYTVVKGMAASSKRPDISIQVRSPKAVIQGFQRDMSRGVQALYTVKNRGASRPSQILIHVNMLKGKDPPAKTETKTQKQGT